MRVDFAPVRFVKVAKAAARAFHIEDLASCRETLRQALEHDGPAVVDGNEPPLPPKFTREQASSLAEALAAARSSARASA